MESVLNVSWWGQRSTVAKVFIIGVPVLAIIGTIAYVTRHSWMPTKEGDKTKTDVPPVKNDITKPVDTIPDKKTEVTPADKPHQVLDATLPNGGVDASAVITTFDRDFDYVKSKGVWFAKSKANPATASTKNALPEWTSLANKPVAISRLDARYPNY